VRLEPIPIPARLPRSAQDGLAVLEGFVQRHAHALMRALVGFTFSTPEERRAGAPQQQSASVLNRRRRAALEWIQAIIAGRIDSTTLHSLSHTWVPQLAGTGPDLHRCQQRASDFIEYLRGAITGLIMDRPQANLVPEAKALHALETVLAVHLGAVRNAALNRAPARARSPVS
jgi:hypothetical protein